MLRLCAAALLVFWVPVLASPPPVAAQQPADSIRAQAERDYHGSDGTGKDGPLSTADLNLLLLYHRYQATADTGAFRPAQSGIQVVDGHVTVDAIARTDAASLRADLEQLGMTEMAVAGRVVSGRLPIEQIPPAAQLASLRALTVPRAETRDVPSPPTPPDGPASPPSSDSQNDAPDAPVENGPILFLLGSALTVLFLETR